MEKTNNAVVVAEYVDTIEAKQTVNPVLFGSAPDTTLVIIKDLDSYESGMAKIKTAKQYVSNVAAVIKQLKIPFQTALDSFKAVEARFSGAAGVYIEQQSSMCLQWKQDEEKRREEERKKQIELLKNLTPFDDPNDIQLIDVKIKSSSGFSRPTKKRIKVTDEDAFWNAACKDPKLRAYWMPNIKAMELAVSQKNAGFVIPPGCVVEQGETLVSK